MSSSATVLKLKLERKWFTEASTIGELSINGQFECFTLEDRVRVDPNPATRENEAKVPGLTAIPAGKYRLAITFSNRFQRPLPLLVDVPGFSGVRIHPGNSDKDTEGCILVGCQRLPNRVGMSRAAFSELFSKLEPVAKLPGADLSIEIGGERK